MDIEPTNFDYILSYVLGFSIFMLPIIIFVRRRREKNRYTGPYYDEGINHKVLEKAEAEVKDMDLLQVLHERYIHLRSFATINGHDRSTMTNLVVFLQEKGIECDFYFSQAYPAGFASMTNGMGEYFLFVDPEKRDQALQALEQYFK